MQNIDFVFKQTRTEAEGYLSQLKAHIEKNPFKFDNEYRNLKSYIDDLKELEEQIKQKESVKLE